MIEECLGEDERSIMRVMALGRTSLLAFAFATLGSCIDYPTTAQPVQSEAPSWWEQAGNHPKELAYWNHTTAPSFITVWLQVPETGRSCRMVVENPIFFGFLAQNWEKLTGERDPLTRERYVAFMMAHESRPIGVGPSTYFDWTFPRSEKDRLQDDILERGCFDEPYSLAELGFESISQLLDAYFEPVADGYWLRDSQDWQASVNPWEPRFIAMLISLNFYVGRGDLAPVMHVRMLTPPP
jgi:hypothetical protein